MHVGDRITLRELQGRWAYNELTSSRFGPKCKPLAGAPALLAKAEAGVPFAELTEDEINQLVSINEVRRPTLVGPLRNYSSFVCDEWSKVQLGNALTIEMFDPPQPSMQFSSYAAAPPSSDPGDARIVASTITSIDKVSLAEPIPVLPVGGGRYQLLDGYLRGLVFMKLAGPDSRIMVWIPAP
jgi:hypothetical protein